MISIPRGNAAARKLSFDHYVATEFGFDGGNVKFRTGGQWRVIPAAAYTFNAPGQISTPPTATPTRWLARPGFTGTDGGEVTGSWGTSQVDLSALTIRAGQDLRLRFDIGRDGCGGIDGWYVDDVTVTVCVLGRRAAEVGRHRGGSEELTRTPGSPDWLKFVLLRGFSRVYRGRGRRIRWSTALATCDEYVSGRLSR